ncbi:MAG: choice-of-anchor tandem repeat GloVer-containing protein [Rhodospirillales bacterium]
MFKLAPNGTETVLHTFTNVNDGGLPYASVLRDKAGNLYGTTYQGGANGSGFGTVFKLAKNGSFTTLYAFTGGSDGKNPDGGLIRDSAGNLYGTTIHGGGFSSGVVFKVAPDGAETVLYTFTENAGDGGLPIAGVIMDKAGNLYGTTAYGGTSENGTVFKLAPDGTETVLYSFAGGTDGSLPYAGLMMDGAGNLFGTTTAGGANFGVVFKLAPNGKETVLHTFGGYPVDGSTPLFGSLIKDADDGVGYLFGTTQGGGTDNGIAKGTIFKVHK